ncbi:hypothetical protein [Allorhizocola rhizosphaerae]|uniref:hypothetical protein n=1 Tax=Allorhizocola rhizosphaerae TaxID=1872709 RepID=UPI0013C3587D|nr:hypothetical protein [Allorhizocola rhizosphaerae]
MSELNMQVAGTEKGIEGVRQATETVQQAWTSGQGAVSAVEGGLGLGKMGEAFMSVYRPEVERAREQVLAIVAGGRELVAASRQSIEDYRFVDQRLRAEFENLLSPGLLSAWGRR